MSNERGKPVHLTKGERRLLKELVRLELARLAEDAPAGLQPLAGEAKHAERIRKMRVKQYNRLLLELEILRPEPLVAELPAME